MLNLSARGNFKVLAGPSNQRHTYGIPSGEVRCKTLDAPHGRERRYKAIKTFGNWWWTSKKTTTPQGTCKIFAKWIYKNCKNSKYMKKGRNLFFHVVLLIVRSYLYIQLLYEFDLIFHVFKPTKPVIALTMQWCDHGLHWTTLLTVPSHIAEMCAHVHSSLRLRSALMLKTAWSVHIFGKDFSTKLGANKYTLRIQTLQLTYCSAQQPPPELFLLWKRSCGGEIQRWNYTDIQSILRLVTYINIYNTLDMILNTKTSLKDSCILNSSIQFLEKVQ